MNWKDIFHRIIWNFVHLDSYFEMHVMYIKRILIALIWETCIIIYFFVLWPWKRKIDAILVNEWLHRALLLINKENKEYQYWYHHNLKLLMCSSCKRSSWFGFQDRVWAMDLWITRIQQMQKKPSTHSTDYDCRTNSLRLETHYCRDRGFFFPSLQIS